MGKPKNYKNFDFKFQHKNFSQNKKKTFSDSFLPKHE